MIGTEGQVRRKCSGRLKIPGREEPNFKELASSLREQFGESSIGGVQAFGKGRFELLFTSERLLNIASEQGFVFGNGKFDIEPVDTPVKWLFVKFAPFELDRGDFERYLEPYGKIRSIEFVYPEEIKPWHNGERKISFVMKKDVPNFLKLGTYTVQIRYSGVVSLCRKCHGSGHVAKECKSDKCRRCGLPGHMETGCPHETGENMSPETKRIVIQARDELVKKLNVARTGKTLTSEEEGSNDEEQEQSKELTREEKQESIEDRRGDENEYETGRGEDTSEELDDHSEGMPELESEEEQEDDRKQLNLKRKEYLKEKEGSVSEGGSKACQEEEPRKKKLTKQERKKRRQTEERERNKKREREESKSPTGEPSGESKRATEEEKRIREEPEERKEEGKETGRKGKEQAEGKHFWLFYHWPDKTFGEIKEIMSMNLGSGIVKLIKEMDDGLWVLVFTERRWADQMVDNGIRENKELHFPQEVYEVSPAKTENIDRWKKRSMRRND